MHFVHLGYSYAEKRNKGRYDRLPVETGENYVEL